MLWFLVQSSALLQSNLISLSPDSCKILKPHKKWTDNTSKDFQSEVMYRKWVLEKPKLKKKRTNKRQILRNVSMLTRGGFGFCKNSKWQTGRWKHISRIRCDVAHIDFLWQLFMLFLTKTTNTRPPWGDQKYSSLSSVKKLIFLCTVYMSLTVILTPTGQDVHFQGEKLVRAC